MRKALIVIQVLLVLGALFWLLAPETEQPPSPAKPPAPPPVEPPSSHPGPSNW